MNARGWYAWFRSVVGALVILAGAGVLVYKVISDYRPATANGFVSWEDSRATPAATSAAELPLPPAATPSESAPSPATAVVDEVCAGLKEEVREIETAMHRPNTDPEINYMRHRLKELREQISRRACEQ